MKQTSEWHRGASVAIQVRNGVPVSIMNLDEKGTTWQPAASYDSGVVEYLFGIIQRGIDEGADHLVVNYERRRGFPLSAQIDHSGWADDAHSFVVEDFRILR